MTIGVFFIEKIHIIVFVTVFKIAVHGKTIFVKYKKHIIVSVTVFKNAVHGYTKFLKHRFGFLEIVVQSVVRCYTSKT